MGYGTTATAFLKGCRVEQAALTESDFNRLTETEKLEIIKKQGRLVTGLQDQTSSYQLYLLDSFYVEVVKSGKQQHIRIN